MTKIRESVALGVFAVLCVPNIVVAGNSSDSADHPIVRLMSEKIRGFELTVAWPGVLFPGGNSVDSACKC